MLLFPLVCWAYIFFVLAALKIYQKPDGRNMVCGKASDFYITLQNESIFSFSSLRIIFYSSFSTVSEINDNAVYELPPHSSLQRTAKLLCRYRGEYQVGIKQIVVSDFFGLFSFTWKLQEPLSVIVAPAMIELNELRSDELPSSADRDSLTERTEPDIPLREYAEGDDVRMLNWKASAAMQKLMLRERKGEERSGIAIVMDPGRYSEETEEYLPPENRLIESMLALSLYYGKKNIPAEAIFGMGPDERRLIRSVSDHELLYETMSRFSFREDKDFEELLLSLRALSGYRLLIFILQKEDPVIFERIAQLNTDLVPVRIYLASEEAPEGVENGGDQRFALFRIGTEKATEAVL